MSAERCLICGELAEEHHKFVAPKRPSSACVCDAGTWGDPQAIPAICDRYEGPGYCANCEHDRECHAADATLSTDTETPKET